MLLVVYPRSSTTGCQCFGFGEHSSYPNSLDSVEQSTIQNRVHIQVKTDMYVRYHRRVLQVGLSWLRIAESTDAPTSTVRRTPVGEDGTSSQDPF